jgi:hypothetical protein
MVPPETPSLNKVIYVVFDINLRGIVASLTLKN